MPNRRVEGVLPPLGAEAVPPSPDGRSSRCGRTVVVVAVAAFLASGCAPGFINWSGEQSGGEAPPADLTAAGGPLHCSGAGDMTNDAVERFLESKGYTVSWRVDGPEVDMAPSDETLLVDATVAPDRPGEAELLAFTVDGEFSAQAEGLRQGFVDRVQAGCSP